MTITETHPEEAPLRHGVFVRMARFAHCRRWLAPILWVAVLAGVWAAASVVGDDRREGLA